MRRQTRNRRTNLKVQVVITVEKQQAGEGHGDLWGESYCEQQHFAPSLLLRGATFHVVTQVTIQFQGVR